MKNKKEKKKKSKAGKVILFLLFLVILLAALLFFGKGFGFGLGGLGFGTNNEQAAEAMATVSTTAADTPEIIPSGPITIEINETAINFGGESFDTYEAFEKYFYENADKESEYILKDNMAIKSVYDSVKSLLDSFGANYSEENV